MTQRVFTLGHSPDSDDAFMFYALAKGLVDTGPFSYRHVIEDIESLNRRAKIGELDITAVSVHAYAHVGKMYAFLSCGASVGDGYGPIVVVRKGTTLDKARTGKIAVPGEWTSAFLALRLFLGEFRYEVVPFDRILDKVAAGESDAGLIIHEGQVTYKDKGLESVVDLGKWWCGETGLILPLGAITVRRSIDTPTVRLISKHLRESFEYGLAHRSQGLDHARQFARDLDRERMDRFVGMYVNDWTLDLGARGKASFKEFLRRGAEVGLFPMPDVDFADET